jgi:hypothetical protein
MKKTILIFAVIVMITGLTSNLIAQTSATVAATAAGAKLIAPMTLTQTSPLHFGTINVLLAAGGTVALSTANVRTPSAGVALSAVAPTSTNAAYNVTGTISSTYAVTLPATITVLHSITPANTMTISLLKIKFNGGSETTVLTSTLSGAGTDSFIVGGTLTVGAAQLAGIYAGTFAVTVDYN